MQNPPAETVLDRAMVYHGALVRVERWRVRTPDDRDALREIVRHPGGAAVVALSVAREVTLVRQYRVAMDRPMLELPAGKRDTLDEDPTVCARRELEEETGLTAGTLRPLTALHPSPGFLTEKIHLYLATDLGTCPPRPDEGEFLQVVTLPLEQALRLIDRGEITDAKTVCGLLLTKRLLEAEEKTA